MAVPVFGPGIMIVTRTDVTPSTPVNLGFVQEFSLDFDGDIKELFGQDQFAIDVARSTTKISGKMKGAVFSGLAMNTVFFGQSFSSGGVTWNVNEAASIPATPGPYTITVANAATFEDPSGDLGVLFTASGLPLKKVASAPTAGQYSVDESTGVYTFAAADQGLAVKITYRSTVVPGQTLDIDNTTIGTTPVFRMDYYTVRNNKKSIIRMEACTGKKVMLAHKLTEFMMPDYEFGAFANAANKIGSIYYPEVS
jgi:hypothetical protein